MKRTLLIFVIFLCTEITKANNWIINISQKDTAVIALNTKDLPKFPGGEKGFNQFLKKNLKWPKTNIDAQGKVYLTFIIQKDGRLTNAKVYRGLAAPFNEEALRVINKSPRWIPGKRNGKSIDTRYYLPISFYPPQ